MDAEFWYRNLRQTVQFEPAVRAMAQAGIDTLIEVGPHPVLTAPALETLESELGDAGEAAALGSLRRDEGGLDRFVGSLAEAHVHGVRSTGSRCSRAPSGWTSRATPSSASATGCLPGPALRTRRRSARSRPSIRCSARGCRSRTARDALHRPSVARVAAVARRSCGPRHRRRAGRGIPRARAPRGSRDRRRGDQGADAVRASRARREGGRHAAADRRGP